MNPTTLSFSCYFCCYCQFVVFSFYFLFCLFFFCALCFYLQVCYCYFCAGNSPLLSPLQLRNITSLIQIEIIAIIIGVFMEGRVKKIRNISEQHLVVVAACWLLAVGLSFLRQSQIMICYLLWLLFVFGPKAYVAYE